MKQIKTVKTKIIAMLACIFMLTSMTACEGGDAVTVELSNTIIQADVQDYITTFIDKSAKVTSFTQENNSVSATEMEVVCNAAYAGEVESGSGIFTLTYELVNNTWTLENCSVSLSDIADTAQAPDTTTSEAVQDQQSEEVTVETSDDASVQEKASPETPAQEEATQTPAPTKQQTNNTTTSAETGEATPSGILAGYSVEEVGTFEDASVGTTDVYRGKLVVKYYDDNTIAALTTTGQISNKTKYGYIEELDAPEGSDDSGYYVVSLPNSSDENDTGLIDIDGNELIPCEALWIDWSYGTAKTGRYLEVYYSTGETTQDDDYFISISNWSSNETHYYNGYARVYDLYNKSFVGDIQIHNGDRNALNACGDSFVVEEPSRTYTIYNSNGQQIFQTTEWVNTGKGFFTFNSGRTYYIYDESGNETYTTSNNKQLNLLHNHCEYLTEYENDSGLVSIIDKNGKQVVPGQFSYVYEEHDGIFKVKNADQTKYQLVDLDGNVVYETTNDINWIIDSYWYSSDSIGNKVLIGPNGVIAEGLKDGNINKLVLISGQDYFVIKDGAFSLPISASYTDSLTYGMISSKEVSGKYMVYDLFTGQKLLPTEYAKILYAAGYVYGLDSGTSTWHAYKVNRIYK